jgi:phytoene dehydrogenase-like protein
MDHPLTDNTLAIIGGGITGLCAGCYAAMNGYTAHVFETNEQPGGLCTTWQRGEYKFDGAVHFLIGSAPGGLFNQYWREVGALQGRVFIHHEALARFESLDGRELCFYHDLDRLRTHLLKLSPSDAPTIEDFIEGVRFFSRYQPPIDVMPELLGPVEGLRLLWETFPSLRVLRKWSRLSLGDFAARFTDPLLQTGFRLVLPESFSTFLLMATLAWQMQHNADYPIGGSLPLAQSIAHRFEALGGHLHYGARVAAVLTEPGRPGRERAVGLRLEDGHEYRAGAVISAADGHATLFMLLNGRFLSGPAAECYQSWPVFPSLVNLYLGVNRQFTEPSTVSGLAFPVDPPVTLGDRTWDHLFVRIVNFDPSFAPHGKTVVTVSLWSDYDYWKPLSADPAAYQAKKQEILRAILGLLDRRWPGLSAQVEETDIVTPITYERHTGNWRGSPQGWLPSPRTALKQLPRTLPGLDGFYLAGQWSEPGGGLPAAVRSGRNVIRLICHHDGKPFTASED